MSGCYRTHQSETPNQTDLTSNHQLQPIDTAEHCGMYSGFQGWYVIYATITDIYT